MTTEPNQAAALREQGIQAWRRGKLARAVELLSEALALDPNDVEARLKRAEALREQGRLAEAQSDLAAVQRVQGGPGGAPPFAYLPTRSPQYPAELSVPLPARMSRLLLLVKWLAVIPLLLWLSLYGVYAGTVGFIGMSITLFTGRYPRGLWEVVRAYQERQYKVIAYFPGFLTDSWYGEGIRLRVDYPDKQRRWLVLIRLVLSPLVIVLTYGTWIVLQVIAFLSFWVILFTGKPSTDLFKGTLAILQWQARVGVWMANLRDDKKLFRAPAGVWIAAVLGLAVVGLSIGALAAVGTLGLNSFSQGQRVVNTFMEAGERQDVVKAVQQAKPGSPFFRDVAGLLRQRRLFEGYERTRIRTWATENPFSATASMTLTGDIIYATQPNGTFAATLDKVDGTWKLATFQITRAQAP